MEVQQDKDRRVGGGSEKLLTLKEAAKRLGVAPDDVEAMIRSGRLQAFRLGGSFLRVRRKDVEAMYAEVSPMPSLSPTSARERLADFLYFNDFYLLAILVILTLIAVILIL